MSSKAFYVGYDSMTTGEYPFEPMCCLRLANYVLIVFFLPIFLASAMNLSLHPTTPRLIVKSEGEVSLAKAQSLRHQK